MTDTNIPSAYPVDPRVVSSVPIGSDQNASGDFETVLVAPTKQIGASTAQIADAALANNAGSAPSNALETRVQSIETMIASGGAAFDALTGAARSALPEYASTFDRISTIEARVADFVAYIEKSEPIFARMLAAFDGHFGGKI